MKKSLGGTRVSLVALFGLVMAAVASGQTVTEFTIPTASSLPVGIAAGPDGALWFPEFSVNQIGKITTGAAPPLGPTIPTLDARGLIALTLILAAMGAFLIRRMGS